MVDPTHLITYTVYRKPLDYPDSFVVRRFRVVASAVQPDPEPWSVTATLSEARASIPVGLFCLLRSVDDDPNIVETWL